MPQPSRQTWCVLTANLLFICRYLKQGGDSNTIVIVDGIKKAIANLLDVPKNLVTKVVFDQSVFVKNAIDNLIHEGAIGLILTGLMILDFFREFTRNSGCVFFHTAFYMCCFFNFVFDG